MIRYAVTLAGAAYLLDRQIDALHKALDGLGKGIAAELLPSLESLSAMLGDQEKAGRTHC